MAQKLPLAGIRVIELGTLLAGPFSTRFFGDFGAEVIKIEAPRIGDPMRQFGPIQVKNRGLLWPTQSRNKKCITLDLRVSEGQNLAKRLIKEADIVVENFRPGTLEKWNLAYEDLRSVNPGIIMIRVSGYGQTGPYRSRAGFGAAAGAMGGLRHLTGYPELPPTRVGLSLEDSLASLQAVIGGMLALYHRDVHDGEGQVVDISIAESVFAMTESAVTEYALTGYVRDRQGTTLAGVAPSNIYQTSDKIWMVIAANGDNPFKRLFTLMNRSDIATDPKYTTAKGRYQSMEFLDNLISNWTKQYSSSDLSKILEEAGVPAAPIYSAAEIVSDPHFRSREMIIKTEDPILGSISMPGIMPKLVRTPGRIEWTGPELGEHNEEIYRSFLGLSEQEYTNYKETGII